MTDPTGVEDHLREHLTDGQFHDSCSYCQRRRRKGGTGVTDDEIIAANRCTAVPSGRHLWVGFTCSNCHYDPRGRKP